MRAPLTPIDFEAEDAGSMIVNDLYSTGFCVLRNHPADLGELENLRLRWRNWFEQTSDIVKESYAFDYTQAGYFSQDEAERPRGAGGRRDLKEYFHVYGDEFEGLPVALSYATELHFKEMNSLATEILAMIEASLPSDMEALNLHKCAQDSAMTMLRAVYYPELGAQEMEVARKQRDDACRAGAHTDVNLITLIPCNAERGLQLYTSAKKWEPVPWHSTYLVLNAGDMLESMSGGYFKSAKHRVVTPPKGEPARLSLPFFVHPRRDWRVSETENAGQFLRRRLLELGVAT